MTRKLTEAQRDYAKAGTRGMRKDAIRRAQQIVAQRGYIYNGWLAPTCLKCGQLRERHMKGNHCSLCEGLS